MSEPRNALGARMLGPPHDDNRHSALPAAAAKARACAGQTWETTPDEAAGTPVAATEALGAATRSNGSQCPSAEEPGRERGSQPPRRLLRIDYRS